MRVGCRIGGARHSPWLCWRGRDLRRSYQEADAAYVAALGSFPTVGAARAATAGLPIAAPLRMRVGCSIGGARHSPWLYWRGRDLRRSYRGQTPLTPPRWVRFRL